MSNLFLQNPFNILGLLTDASDKDIRKRAKEIDALLKIDEIPEYDYDIDVISHRTEKNVKQAENELLDEKLNFTYSWFWFTIHNDIDELGIRNLGEGKYTDGIKIIDQNTQNPFSVRNSAIAICLSIEKKYTKAQVEKSIKLWSKVYNEQVRFSRFKKYYLLNHENCNLSDGEMDKILDDLKLKLSDYFAEVSLKNEDNSAYAEYAKEFNIHGKVFNEQIMQPLLTELENQSNDFTDTSSINKIKETTDELQAFGNNVWNDSKVIIIRDEVATSIRSAGINIANAIDRVDDFENNNSKQLKIVKKFFDFSLSIAGSNGLKEKIRKDLEDYEETISVIKKSSNENKLFEEFEKLSKEFIKYKESKDWFYLSKAEDALEQLLSPKFNFPIDNKLRENLEVQLKEIRARIEVQSNQRYRKDQRIYRIKEFLKDHKVAIIIWGIIVIIYIILPILSNLGYTSEKNTNQNNNPISTTSVSLSKQKLCKIGDYFFDCRNKLQENFNNVCPGAARDYFSRDGFISTIYIPDLCYKRYDELSRLFDSPPKGCLYISDTECKVKRVHYGLELVKE
jgi:hypothetical protein